MIDFLIIIQIFFCFLKQFHHHQHWPQGSLIHTHTHAHSQQEYYYYCQALRIKLASQRTKKNWIICNQLIYIQICACGKTFSFCFFLFFFNITFFLIKKNKIKINKKKLFQMRNFPSPPPPPPTAANKMNSSVQELFGEKIEKINKTKSTKQIANCN